MSAKAITAVIATALLASCAANTQNSVNPGADEVSVTNISVSDPGDYMDRQEAEMRQKLEGTGVTIVRTPKYIALVFQSSITFATDSAEVVPEFAPSLAVIAGLLQKYNATDIDVNGYTDSTGSDAYNLKLSQQRANAVAGALIQRGVSPQRIMPVGYGKADPVATNDTADGRAQNRRVEIRIAPPPAAGATGATAAATN
ncbi:OmpA family protein [Martelella mangrovi]|uniref:Outer membrane protein OmpA-like peptidoglycan-associated protein n=1 Tax=Martelella mangrovi TaxID=1397477 RepID=A0ABV2I8P8_9HYPH